MKRNYLLLFASLLIVISIVFAACSGSRQVSSASNWAKSNCYNQTDYRYTEADLPRPFHHIKIDTALGNRFSFESLNVANAIGLLDYLAQYAALKIEYPQNPTIEKRVALLELRQTITEKINISSLEISSVASELNCEEERASQISNYLKSKGDQREKNLVISSIIIGAAGAIAVEGVNNSPSTGKTGSYLGVGVSLLEATLGFLMLTNRQKVSFSHVRNTPGEIWLAPTTSKTLPTSIWYYLNYKDSDKRKVSLRELLVENWAAFGQVSQPTAQDKKKQSQLYFGNGGKYGAEELQNRADMYDQIEAYINLMKQDLKILSLEFKNFS